jgi:uncharacterized membrane protein
VFLAAWSWFTFWLILHIIAVVIAFGPTYAFPLIGKYAEGHPEAGPTVAHLMDLIEKRITIPVAIVVPLLGTALIFSGHFDLWKNEWLIISIVLYIVLFAFGVLVQGRNSTRLVRAIASMPAGPPPPGAPPPAEILSLTRKLQMGGMFLSVLIIAILVLMVWRPGECRFC